MAQHPAGFSLTRRRFFLAAGATAASLTPAAHAANVLWPDRALRVGVVMTQSRRLPGLSDQIVSGFQSYLAGTDGRVAGSRIELVPLACECGPRSPIAAAREAVEEGRVDLLLGMVNRNPATQLRPLLERTGTPFIITDSGADIVREGREGTFLIRNSLGYWQANHAMGAWSRANLGARVLIATDFLEAGYDMVYAFRQAFEAAGGEVTSVQVTGRPDREESFDGLSAAIRDQRPDFVYAFYSGRRASAFFDYYGEQGWAGTVPLAGPGLLTDSASDAIPRNLAGVVTAAGWRSGTQPFEMLGREAAQRIDVALAALDGRSANRTVLATELANAHFDGPRGAVASLDGMAEAAMPIHVRRLESTALGMVNADIARLDAATLSASIRTELRTATKTGWLHAYLAA